MRTALRLTPLLIAMGHLGRQCRKQIRLDDQHGLHRGGIQSRGACVLRSWGKGLYKTPHSIRIDPQGNVWTVDAESSVVLKFTPEGKELLKIEVGEQPTGRKE